MGRLITGVIRTCLDQITRIIREMVTMTHIAQKSKFVCSMVSQVLESVLE